MSTLRARCTEGQLCLLGGALSCLDLGLHGPHLCFNIIDLLLQPNLAFIENIPCLIVRLLSCGQHCPERLKQVGTLSAATLKLGSDAVPSLLLCAALLAELGGQAVQALEVGFLHAQPTLQEFPPSFAVATLLVRPLAMAAWLPTARALTLLFEGRILTIRRMSSFPLACQ